MSSTGLKLPGCPAAAYHRDHAPHIFYCDLPLAHDGDHAHKSGPGVWISWSITFGFDTTAPANPAPCPSVAHSILFGPMDFPCDLTAGHPDVHTHLMKDGRKLEWGSGFPIRPASPAEDD